MTPTIPGLRRAVTEPSSDDPVVTGPQDRSRRELFLAGERRRAGSLPPRHRLDCLGGRCPRPPRRGRAVPRPYGARPRPRACQTPLCRPPHRRLARCPDGAQPRAVQRHPDRAGQRDLGERGLRLHPRAPASRLGLHRPRGPGPGGGRHGAAAGLRPRPLRGGGHRPARVQGRSRLFGPAHPRPGSMAANSPISPPSRGRRSSASSPPARVSASPRAPSPCAPPIHAARSSPNSAPSGSSGRAPAARWCCIASSIPPPPPRP